MEVENEMNSFYHKLLSIMVFFSEKKNRNWYQTEGNCLDRLEHVLFERAVKAFLSFGIDNPLSDHFLKSCSEIA